MHPREWVLVGMASASLLVAMSSWVSASRTGRILERSLARGGTIRGNIVMSGADILVRDGNQLCFDEDDDTCLSVASGDNVIGTANGGTVFNWSTGGFGVTGSGDALVVGTDGNFPTKFHLGSDTNGVAAGDCDAAAEGGEIIIDENDNILKICDQLGTTTGWKTWIDLSD